MAKFVVTPAGVQMKLYWTQAGYNIVNVFGGRATGASTFDQAKADALRDLVLGAATSSGLLTHMVGSTTLTAVSIRNVAIADQVENISNVTGGTGTSPDGNALPRAAAVVCTFKTALAGKSNRGRSYMSGFSEASNGIGSAIDEPTITSVEAFWQAIHDNLPTLLIQQSILSPALPQRPSSIPGAPDLPAKLSSNEPVTSLLVRSNVWGSQRRRNHRT